MKQIVITLAAGLLFCVPTFAQTMPIYKDSAQPIEKRISDLLSRMTIEEKFWQLFMIPGDIPAGEEAKYQNGIFGFQVRASQKKGDAGAQMLDYGVSDDAASLRDLTNRLQKYFIERSRLGIPMIAFDEALHRLVRGGATAFPQAIALGATWDTALVRRVSEAVAAEARVRGIRDVLSPVINIADDPRWGRIEETYGEDPLLTSAIAVSVCERLLRRRVSSQRQNILWPMTAPGGGTAIRYTIMNDYWTRSIFRLFGHVLKREEAGVS